MTNKMEIHWKSISRNVYGQGSPMETEMALKLIKEANIKWKGEIKHWGVVIN